MTLLHRNKPDTRGIRTDLAATSVSHLSATEFRAFQGIAILVPTTAGLAGLWLAVTMFFAVLTHLFVIGGSPAPAPAPAPALVLLVATTIVWLHRANVVATYGRLSRS